MKKGRFLFIPNIKNYGFSFIDTSFVIDSDFQAMIDQIIITDVRKIALTFISRDTVL